MAKFFTTRKTFTTMSDINMTPLVDLVSSLLIIFMIIAPVIQKGIEVHVPGSSAGKNLPERDFHTVSITLSGDVWFDAQQIPLEKLPEYLQSLSPDQTIYVQADQNILYGHVVAVITLIKEHGIRQVGLITNPTGKKQQ